MGVSQYESKSRNRKSIQYSPIYVHQLTSNSKVRYKRHQVICQRFAYAPYGSNYNSIPPCVLYVIVAMPKLMNQFGLIYNTIHSWHLNYSLRCSWLTQFDGGTVIGRQSCVKSVWYTQVLFSWYVCNKIIKLRIIGVHLYYLLTPTLFSRPNLVNWSKIAALWHSEVPSSGMISPERQMVLNFFL